MKLKDYKLLIDKLVEEGHGNKTIIYSKDSEGNGFEDVCFKPTILKIKDIYGYYGKAKGKVICIN